MNFLKTVKQSIGLNYKTLFWLYLICVLVQTIPKVLAHSFNNYLIFSDSFLLLKNHDNPYLFHADLYDDLFRYSPTFAVLVAPFATMPLYLGIIAWNYLNSLSLFFSIKYLFKNDERKGALVLLTILLEVLTVVANTQINSLVTAIMVFSYACFIYKKEAWAAVLCMLNLFIKIYGFAAAALFFFSKKKFKFVSASALSFIGFMVIPLIYISIPELTNLYKTEFSSIDAYSVNLSFMGILRCWFGFEFNDRIIQVMALVVVCLPIIPGMFKSEEQKRRLQELLICSILTFLCAFNQMAESPTYVIAVTGAAIWYFTSPPSKLNKLLFILLVVFCVFASSDLYPRSIRIEFFEPYKIKAFPIVLIWIKIQWDTWKLNIEKVKLETSL